MGDLSINHYPRHEALLQQQIVGGGDLIVLVCFDRSSCALLADAVLLDFAEYQQVQRDAVEPDDDALPQRERLLEEVVHSIGLPCRSQTKGAVALPRG